MLLHNCHNVGGPYKYRSVFIYPNDSLQKDYSTKTNRNLPESLHDFYIDPDVSQLPVERATIAMIAKTKTLALCTEFIRKGIK